MRYQTYMKMTKIKNTGNSKCWCRFRAIEESKAKNIFNMIPLYKAHKNGKLNLRLGIRIMVDFGNMGGSNDLDMK